MARASSRPLLALALGSAAALAVLAGAEGWVRHAEARAGLVIPRDQPGRKYALAPGHRGEGASLNASGFNDDFSEERTEGVARVVLLGDSVSFGSGIERAETYASQAERILARDGVRVEILNLSVYGYDVEQEAATLHYVGWPLRPDLVVYAWFPNDAFPTNLIAVGEGGAPAFVGSSVSDEVALGGRALALWACRRSALARRFYGAREARTATGSRAADLDFFAYWFDAMAADAREHATPLAVYALLPHVLADPDPSTCGRPTEDARYCAGQLEALEQARVVAERRGVPFVSALPWLRAGPARSYPPAGSPDDAIHASPEGHALFAEGLAEIVRRWRAGTLGPAGGP